MTGLSTPLLPSNVGGTVWSGSGDEGGGGRVRRLSGGETHRRASPSARRWRWPQPITGVTNAQSPRFRWRLVMMNANRRVAVVTRWPRRSHPGWQDGAETVQLERTRIQSTVKPSSQEAAAVTLLKAPASPKMQFFVWEEIITEERQRFFITGPTRGESGLSPACLADSSTNHHSSTEASQIGSSRVKKPVHGALSEASLHGCAVLLSPVHRHLFVGGVIAHSLHIQR